MRTYSPFSQNHLPIQMPMWTLCATSALVTRGSGVSARISRPILSHSESLEWTLRALHRLLNNSLRAFSKTKNAYSRLLAPSSVVLLSFKTLFVHSITCQFFAVHIFRTFSRTSISHKVPAYLRLLPPPCKNPLSLES